MKRPQEARVPANASEGQKRFPINQVLADEREQGRRAGISAMSGSMAMLYVRAFKKIEVSQ
jgi:hypothetical protein